MIHEEEENERKSVAHAKSHWQGRRSVRVNQESMTFFSSYSDPDITHNCTLLSQICHEQLARFGRVFDEL